MITEYIKTAVSVPVTDTLRVKFTTRIQRTISSRTVNGSRNSCYKWGHVGVCIWAQGTNVPTVHRECEFLYDRKGNEQFSNYSRCILVCFCG